MNSRERILAVLQGRRPDRVPFDIWYTPEVRDQLMKHFKTEEETEVWEALQIDKIVMVEASYPHRSSPWGDKTTVIKQEGGGSYEETSYYPLAAIERLEQVIDYDWPNPELFDYEALKLTCSSLSQKWVCMLSFVSIFEVYCKLRPMDEAMMDLYINEEIATYIIEKIVEIQLSYIERAFETCGDMIDIVYLSDDMGMQDRMLIAYDKWEEMFKPHYSRLIDLIHEKGAYAFYHRDGAAFPVLKTMVEMGVDVINPIQHNCPGMEREHLIEELGASVVFHGAIENQYTLPFGTVDEVIAEVAEDIRVLNRYHRYICSSCHNIQAGTPLENILAIYQVDREFS